MLLPYMFSTSSRSRECCDSGDISSSVLLYSKPSKALGCWLDGIQHIGAASQGADTSPTITRSHFQSGGVDDSNSDDTQVTATARGLAQS